MRKYGLLLLALLLCCCAVSGAEETGFATGETREGFTVARIERFDLINADMITLEHVKTGASVLLLLNEDTNRSFQIAFRTPAKDNTGTPHVFEHATLDGSVKYPSKTLFMSLTNQTYMTYMNAATYSTGYTTFPLASLSEAQLLLTADYYLDSVFNPLLMDDESIFREEAWRYAMDSADGELTIAGTVYSEMSGAYDIDRAASLNFNSVLYPGSVTQYSTGGIPAFIPDMTWQSLKDFHDTYYHPSNSLTVLYGKIDDADAFLAKMDAYFSAYEKKAFDFADAAYQPLSESVVREFAFPAEKDSDTENGATIYKGYLCPDASKEDMDALDLMTTLMCADGSPFVQKAKELMPSAQVSCYISAAEPDPSLIFCATNVNRGDAAVFDQLIESAMRDIAENGFSQALVEAVAHENRLSVLLTGESTSLGTDISATICYYWFLNDRSYDFTRTVEVLDHIAEYNDGGVYADAARRFVLDNALSATAITYPQAGLKNENEAALKEKLAGIKAGMSDEEIAAIVAQTNAREETSAGADAAYVSALTAVTVESLPEETRIYEISDETDGENVRRLYAKAGIEGLGTGYLLLDASAVPQEDLLWYRLFVTILGQLDTAQYDKTEISARITRNLYNYSVNNAIYKGEKSGNVTPYLRVSFMALDGDMESAYELLYEMLYHTQFSDAQAVLGFVQRAAASLKRTLNQDGLNLIINRANARGDQTGAYYLYTHSLDYCHFLGEVEQMLADDPQAVLDKLASFQSLFHNRYGAVSGYAGAESGNAAHRAAADAFLNKLDCAPVAPAAYAFEEIADSEAVILDIANQYNIMSARYEEIGLEDYTADISVLGNLLSDAFLLPLLRDQYGVYGAYAAASDERFFLYTIYDNNIAETFDVYRALPGLLRGYTVDQSTLDGYILSTYSNYAQQSGELSGAYAALTNAVSEIPQERVLDYMRQLKAMKADDIGKYADLLDKLIENAYIATAGSASAINANASLYGAILNPFSAADVTQTAFADVTEDMPAYRALRFAYENMLMKARGDDAFGALEPATLGDAAAAMYAVLGGGTDEDEAIAYLAPYGIVPGDVPAQKELTREELCALYGNFCAAVGIEAAPAPLPEAADAADVSEEAKAAVGWCLSVGALSADDGGAIRPQALATRAELAQMLYVLFDE